MLIVKLQTEENGARANQLIYPELPAVPEGWAAVPPELEAEALEFLPWMSIETQDGLIVGIGDDTQARALALERAAAGAKAAETADGDEDTQE